MGTRVEVLPEEHLPPATRAAIDDWTAIVFGPQGYVIAPMVWRVLLWEGDDLVSHVGLVRRAIDAGGVAVDVAGFGWVGTRAEWRGRSLGSTAMRRAAAYARDDLRTEASLLVCDEQTTPFYASLGWRRATGPLSFDQPAGPVAWPGAAMVLPGTRPDWPPGAIDLRGLLW